MLSALSNKPISLITEFLLTEIACLWIMHFIVTLFAAVASSILKKPIKHVCENIDRWITARLLRRNTQFPEQELFVEIEVCTWWHCEVANSIRYADGQILYWKNSLISHFWGHLEKHVPRFRLIDAELIHQTECNTFHFTSSNNSRYINAKIRFSMKNYQIGRLD